MSEQRGQTNSNNVSTLQRILWVCNLILHQATAVFTFWILWLCLKNLDLGVFRSWHVILSTIAYIPIMTEGFILFSSDNLWTQRLDRKMKYWLHGGLLFLGMAILTVGIFVETYAKTQTGRDLFYSEHGLTGLVSWIIGMLTMVLGNLSWNAQKLKHIFKPVFFKFIHNFLALFSFVVGIVSLIYGYYYTTFENLVTVAERDAIIWITAILSVWSCLTAFKSCYHQFKSLLS